MVAAAPSTIIGAQAGQGWFAPMLGSVAFTLAVAAVGSLFVAEWIAQRRWISLELDGSGRWVLLRGVHPEFARSVVETVRRDAERSRQ